MAMRSLIWIIIVNLLFIVKGLIPASAAGYECFDARGRSVSLVEDDHLKQIALAAVDPIGGEPVVYFNPALFTWIHPSTRLFFLAHECAHHRLGQPLGSGLTAEMESAADCRALRDLADIGLLSGEDLVSIQKDLYTFGREEWAGVPGPRRGITPKDCSP
jgi:hypothetical protein